MRKKLTIVTAVVIGLLILDQAIKIYIKTDFESDEVRYVFGNWFALHYVENRGMAFGTTFGSGIFSKLALSIFRLVAFFGISYYIYLEAKKGKSLGFLLTIGLVLAGATGNLLDSMIYDFIFPFNPCEAYNQVSGTGIHMKCHDFGFDYPVEVRHRGFLLGNVVDMFQFDAMWPKWVPGLGGGPIFPAIWNFADACISVGVAIIILRYKRFFPSEQKN